MTYFTDNIRLPPHLNNYAGGPRRIGVEIEFAAVSARDAAAHVHALFGGEIVQKGPHRFEINGTSIGDFTAKLDSQYVHSELPNAEGGVWGDSILKSFQENLQQLFGDIGSFIIPCEIVCPPIEIEKLRWLEDLVASLARAGAEGTGQSLFYAFGVHLNPEIADLSPAYLLSVLKAQVLLSDWLRAVMVFDSTRNMTSFASQFPEPYALKIVREDYRPDLGDLIDDYLDYSPSRNRELDMLPLFCWLDAERVGRKVADGRISNRPTFHYRLPNANIGQENWSLTLEWNRWCVLERLAADRSRLDAMGEAFVRNRQSFLRENWALRSSEWLII